MTLVTLKGYKRMEKIDKWLQAMLRGFFAKMIDEKQGAAECERCFLRKIEEATHLPRHVTKMSEAVVDSKNDFASEQTMVYT